jgi:hypothetical protein
MPFLFFSVQSIVLSIFLVGQSHFFQFHCSLTMLFKLLLLQFVIIVHSVLQDMRSMKLTKLIDTKYQCTSPGCSPSILVPVSSLRDCQIACLADAPCRTASFSQFISQCELFAEIPNEYGTLSAEANVVTMIAIDDRQSSTRK